MLQPPLLLLLLAAAAVLLLLRNRQWVPGAWFKARACLFLCSCRPATPPALAARSPQVPQVP